MNTFPIVLFSLLVPLIVVPLAVVKLKDLSAECNGCYLEGKCFCNHSVGLFRTVYECQEVMCEKKTLSTLKWFCKDNRGNCMESGERRVGVINNRCVKFTCIVWRSIPRMGVSFNIVCTLEHMYEYWKKRDYKEIDQC